MSAIEQASLVGGLINQTLDTELRSKIYLIHKEIV